MAENLPGIFKKGIEHVSFVGRQTAITGMGSLQVTAFEHDDIFCALVKSPTGYLQNFAPALASG